MMGPRGQNRFPSQGTPTPVGGSGTGVPKRVLGLHILQKLPGATQGTSGLWAGAVCPAAIFRLLRMRGAIQTSLCAMQLPTVQAPCPHPALPHPSAKAGLFRERPAPTGTFSAPSSTAATGLLRGGQCD